MEMLCHEKTRFKIWLCVFLPVLFFLFFLLLHRPVVVAASNVGCARAPQQLKANPKGDSSKRPITQALNPRAV